MHLRTTLFTAQGRLSREAYIYGYALVWLFGMASAGLTTVLRDNSLHEFNLIWTPVWMTLQSVAIFCLVTKRAHDLGRSVWRVIAVFLGGALLCDATYNFFDLATAYGDTAGPSVGWPAAMMSGLAAPMAIKLSLLVSWYGVFVWLALSRGQTGLNRFGEPGPRRLAFA